MGVTGIALAVLISGRGSNLQALIDACARDDFPARIAVVVSNRPGVAGLDRARRAGIPALTVDHKAYPTRETFEAALQEALDRYPVDLVCLAGFMRLLTPGFVARWENRMLNIHPSLLPDYKGLDTHARALADGRTQAGCTVHFVRPAMDDGPVVVQRRVPILPGDTPASLAARVLEQEHEAYPQAVRLFAQGRLRLAGDIVDIMPTP